MKQILLVLSLLLALGLHAGIGIAEENPAIEAVYAPDAPYNPAIKYAGTFDQKLLFVKNTRHGNWHLRPYFDRLNYIKCQDALDHLRKDGSWDGIVKNDGSCGLIGRHGELPEWATGNRLNYEEQVSGQYREQDFGQQQQP
jgi:hypothetical protein